MVDDLYSDEVEYEVLLTPHFIDDLTLTIDYIESVLGSPVAAKTMYLAVKDKVEALKRLPQAALSYVSPSGSVRYVVSYKRYDIHYSIEGNVIKVLGLKHSLQDTRYIR